MAKQEAEAGQAKPFLQPGIERVLLIPPQKNVEKLLKALTAGLDAIDRTNADLSPEELEEHVTVIFVSPKPVPGSVLSSFFFVEPPRDQDDTSVTQA